MRWATNLDHISEKKSTSDIVWNELERVKQKNFSVTEKKNRKQAGQRSTNNIVFLLNPGLVRTYRVRVTPCGLISNSHAPKRLYTTSRKLYTCRTSQNYILIDCAVEYWRRTSQGRELASIFE